MPTRPSTQDPDEGALKLPTGMPAQDPTPRTLQSVLRENFWLRELIESRLDGMDKALTLLQAFADRTPTTMDVQHQVMALREVTMQRFAGITTQILERDAQTEKASRNLDAQTRDAFAAAKEAVGEQNKSNALAIAKSEAGVTKQIDGITDLINTTSKGVDDKISDIKERITIIESRTAINDPSTAITLAKLDATVARLTSTTDFGAGKSAGQMAMWALVGAMVSLLLAVGTTIGFLLKHV